MKADTIKDLLVTIVHSSDPSLRVPAITYMADYHTGLLIGCAVVVALGEHSAGRPVVDGPVSGGCSGSKL